MTSGIMKPAETGDFFNPKTPSAMICESTREKIVVLCIIGHMRPPVSYFEQYTLRICKIVKSGLTAEESNRNGKHSQLSFRKGRSK